MADSCTPAFHPKHTRPKRSGEYRSVVDREALHLPNGLRLVRAGLGVAVHPEGTMWPYENAEHICSVPLTDPWASRQLSIFLGVDRNASVATQTLIRHRTEGSAAPAAPNAGQPV